MKRQPQTCLLVILALACPATMAGSTFVMGPLNTVKFEVEQPADITVPAKIHTVAIDLRYDPKKAAKAFKIAEAILSGEHSGQDFLGATAALRGLREALDSTDRFTVAPHVELRPGTGGSSDLLEPAEVREICKAHGLDGLITIDGFDSDVTRVSATDSAPQGDPYLEENPPAVTEEEELSIKLLIRFYDGESGEVIDEAARTKMATLDSDREEVVQALGHQAGRAYLDHVRPWKQTVPRLVFVKGSDSIKRGYKLAAGGDWVAAEREWRISLDDPKAKIRGRAAHDIALAHEMRGDLEGAMEWVERAASEISAMTVKQYRKVLEQRLPDQAQVDRQWDEWKTGVAQHM